MSPGKHVAETWVSSCLRDKTKTVITAVVAASAMTVGTMAVNPLTANAEELSPLTANVEDARSLMVAAQGDEENIPSKVSAYRNDKFLVLDMCETLTAEYGGDTGGCVAPVTEENIAVYPESVNVGDTVALGGFGVYSPRERMSGNNDGVYNPKAGDSFTIGYPSNVDPLEPGGIWGGQGGIFGGQGDPDKGWPIRDIVTGDGTDGPLGYCKEDSGKLTCTLDRDMAEGGAASIIFWSKVTPANGNMPTKIDYTINGSGFTVVGPDEYIPDGGGSNPNQPGNPDNSGSLPGSSDITGSLPGGSGDSGALLALLGGAGLLAGIGGLIGWLLNSGIISLPSIPGLPKF